MSSERAQAAPTDARAQAAPQAAVAPPVPAAPVPLPAIGTLVVGHAEDRAEADADRMADSALARLSQVEGSDAHVHGPGCDHLRRSAAPASGAPVVGYEGGALDSGTSSEIEGRRGSGKPLESGVRRRMETAFGTSLSGVRIHADDAAAKLNTAVSARAFTTGQDVFFGKGQYAPGTPSGDRVLAHELAHTLQPSGAAHRSFAGASPAVRDRAVASSAQIRRINWKFWQDSPEKKQAKEAKKQQEGVQAGAAALGSFAKAGMKTRDEEQAAAKVAAAKKEARGKQTYTGSSGAMSSVDTEENKAMAALGVVDGAFISSNAAELAGKVGAAGAVGSAAGLLTAGDATLGAINAYKMDTEATEFGDKGLAAMAGRKGKAQGMGMLGGAAGIAKSGVEAGFVASTGKFGMKSALEAGANVGDAALRGASGGLGIAIGSVQVAQGIWKGGKAVQKLWRLTKGKGRQMLSAAGQKWKSVLVGTEKFKLGVSAVKIALGVLGIAAGALVLASNPVGWGIGIAAAIAGGVYAATKLYGKIKDAKERAKAAQEIADGTAPPTEVGGVKAEAPRDHAGEKTGHKKERGPESNLERTRREAIEKANDVARRASAYALTAHELREAMSHGDPDVISDGLELETHGVPLEQSVTSLSDRELHDAFMLLSTINVSPEQAVSDSGQELIEKKLSRLEAL